MTGPMVPAPSAIRSPVAVGLAAGAAGLLAQWLFVDTGVGINVPIAIAALLISGWLVRPATHRLPRARDAWLPLAAIGLSAFAALRGDATLVTLDLLGAVALTGAALASFGGFAVVDRPFGSIAELASRVLGSAAVAGSRVIRGLIAVIPGSGARKSVTRAAPILRGLLIALPLVLLFVALFAAADAVFARIARDLFKDLDIDLGSLPARIVVAAAAAWLVAGLLHFVAASDRVDEEGPPPAAVSTLRRLGSTEAATVLIVLDLLFAGFVALQAAYLFGGQDTVQASGLTYAEYARRGFFELLAVALIVGSLILAAEYLVVRRTPAYLATAIGLVGLTAVVLVSALLRLRLYQEAYGWTELRFYVLAAILWLAIGCLFAVVSLATNRSRWLLHGMLALSIVFGIAFNLIGPVRLIAEQNLARAIDPELVAPGGETAVDVWYLNLLGDDAVLPLAEALPDLPPDLRHEVTEILRNRAYDLEHSPGNESWQAWNLSREAARARLLR